jgi:hypothetical protein
MYTLGAKSLVSTPYATCSTLRLIILLNRLYDKLDDCIISMYDKPMTSNFGGPFIERVTHFFVRF